VLRIAEVSHHRTIGGDRTPDGEPESWRRREGNMVDELGLTDAISAVGTEASLAAETPLKCGQE
jgi:hypothetical protein